MRVLLGESSEIWRKIKDSEKLEFSLQFCEQKGMFENIEHLTSSADEANLNAVDQ